MSNIQAQINKINKRLDVIEKRLGITNKSTNIIRESDEAILRELAITWKEYLIWNEEDGVCDIHWGKLQERVGRPIVGDREAEVKFGYPILNKGQTISDEDFKEFKREIK